MFHTISILCFQLKENIIMYFFRRFSLYLIFFLFIFVIYKDLIANPYDTEIENQERKQETVETEQMNFQVKQVKVKRGDTVISVMEQIHTENIEGLTFDRILEDFKTLNPNTDPYNLKSDRFYYFPFYK